MKAEIIAVGSELLTPHSLDTNSLFITERLVDEGFEVHLKTVVGDSESDIAGVVASALQRSKLIVLSGGLGPTEDDLTRMAVAKVVKRPLITDSGVLQKLRQRFASRGYTMAKINERQADIIESAEILENSFGTAPGQWLEYNGRFIVLLPGPPRELKPMFDAHVLPRARKLGAARRLARRSFHVTGFGESDLDALIAPIYKSYKRVQTTVLAAPGHIAVHLYEWFDVGQDEPSEIQEVATKIEAALGNAIFSTTGELLEEAVGKLLLTYNRTLAVAESCTAGLLAMLITRVPGSSGYFLGGALCYSNEVKRDLCGVPEELLNQYGAVSGEVAEALAEGIRERIHSSIGLSITGIAGPGGGSPEKPVGLVYIGLCDGQQKIHKRRIIPGDRDTIRERTCYFALSFLRKYLLEGDERL